jgi:hypothetical protein
VIQRDWSALTSVITRDVFEKKRVTRVVDDLYFEVERIVLFLCC